MKTLPTITIFCKKRNWDIETKFYEKNTSQLSKLIPALFGLSFEIFNAVYSYEYHYTYIANTRGRVLQEITTRWNEGLEVQAVIKDILTDMQGDSLAKDLETIGDDWKELDTYIRPVCFLEWIKNWCNSNEYIFPENLNVIFEKLQAKQCKQEDNTSHIPQEIVKQYEEYAAKEIGKRNKHLLLLLDAARGMTNPELVNKHYPRGKTNHMSGYISSGKDIAQELGLPSLDEYMPEVRKPIKS